MILAGIDIGTNTLRLLIADIDRDSYREISSDRKITRLGQDLDRTGMLAPDAQMRSIKSLAVFSRIIEEHEVDHVAAVGTSALRRASNSGEFISGAKKATGIGISIVTGEEEARLTLLGVTRALGRDNLPPTALVVDIGGGSTEMIITGPEGIRASSLPLGAVYLTERFIRHDPPTEDELEGLRDFIRTEMRNASIGERPDRSQLLAGTAGTITTLAAMDQELTEYDPGRINGCSLTRRSIDAMVRTLRSKTLLERKSIKGLEPGREDIILAGAMIVEEIMDRFGYGTMLVSDWGLREGIVFDLYEKHK